MEQRKDYIESQTDIIARMLKNILEKLLKLKSDDDDMQHILQQQVYEEGPAFTLNDILQINDSLFIAILTNQYGYNAENIKLLADILYEMKSDAATTSNCRRKALILYRYYLASSVINIDYIVYNRINLLETNID